MSSPITVRRNVKRWSNGVDLHLERLNEEKGGFYFAFSQFHPLNFYYIHNTKEQTKMLVFAAGHAGTKHEEDYVYLFVIQSELEILSITNNSDVRNRYKEQCLQILEQKKR